MDRTILADVYSHVPPPALFHYTTQAGLLGMLYSREIWLTHTQYLNDQREYRHAIELAQEQIAQREYLRDKSLATESWVGDALKAMNDGLTGVEGYCVCVFSLSEDNDSLSQWRAYGGKSSGFSVGFSRELLARVCEHSKVRLGKCVYDEEDQERLMAQVVDAVLEEARKLRQPGIPNWARLVSEKMGEYMNLYAPLLKHSSFSGEREWRLISGAILPIAADLHFREGVSTVVPYYKVPLESNDGPRFCPERVVIGPTPHGNEAEHAVRLLLFRKGMEECALQSVVPSKVPYRNW